MLNKMAAEYNAATEEKKRIFNLFMFGISMLILLVMVVIPAGRVYANESYGSFSTLQSNLTNEFEGILNIISGVFTTVALIALAFCAFKWVFGTDPQTVRQAKTWFFYICVGAAVFWGGRGILALVKTISNNALPDDALNATAASSVTHVIQTIKGYINL